MNTFIGNDPRLAHLSTKQLQEELRKEEAREDAAKILERFSDTKKYSPHYGRLVAAAMGEIELKRAGASASFERMPDDED